jgi:hypothetical protein
MSRAWRALARSLPPAKKVGCIPPFIGIRLFVGCSFPRAKDIRRMLSPYFFRGGARAATVGKRNHVSCDELCFKWLGMLDISET